MAANATSRLAVLIDADNAQPAIIDGLLAEVAKYGTAHVKRIYGDWTGTRLSGWKQTLLVHSIQPIQQFGYTSGKNATDSAMIIDAMDLLYTARFDGFCIVSSDSDFTRLAARIRESGLTVYGFGEQKTPAPFVRACDRFIYTEVLSGKEEEPKLAPLPEKVEPAKNKPLLGLLSAAVDASLDDSGWAHLGEVGNYLVKRYPEFDSRQYGHAKLKDLVLATKGFEIESRAGVAGGAKTIVYVRARNMK
ncbi:MAG: NYN domain-containing protein [Xanthomonadales bacterium]|nr:NYN domain-containing protein [Xanthomonadales bacterium]